MSSYKKILIKKFLYPSYLKVNGKSNKLKYLKEISPQQYNTIEHNLTMQQTKLYEFVCDAIDNVPYYKEFAKKNNIHVNQDTIFDDILQFPILTKETIRQNRERLINSQESDYIRNSSGGSTGEPLLLEQSLKMTNDQNATILMQSLTGYEPGDKLLQLWGSERDIIQGSRGIKNQISNFFFRRRLLNTFLVTEDDMFEHIKYINRFRPDYMLCYVQSVYELAQFIKRNNLEVFSPKAIITSAGTLYSDWKEYIEATFKCPVYNQYGSREVGCIAMECESHNGLHINIFNQYLEIVDDAGLPAENGDYGNIIITNFTNRRMPLIRYKIGDIGAFSNETCSCGRGLPKLAEVTGRTVNIFKTRDGKRIDGEYFTHLFYFVEDVKKFQVIQEDYDTVTIKLEIMNSHKDLEPDIKNDLNMKIRLVMGATCKINYEVVDRLMPTASGKFLYTLSKL